MNNRLEECKRINRMTSWEVIVFVQSKLGDVTQIEDYKGDREELRYILEGEIIGLAYEWERKEHNK